MTPTDLLARLQVGQLLLDGGVGTELIKMGIPLESPPERWLSEHPQCIRDVHGKYDRAGVTWAVPFFCRAMHPYGKLVRQFAHHRECEHVAHDVRLISNKSINTA